MTSHSPRLAVREPFDVGDRRYALGEIITDPAEVRAIRADFPAHVTAMDPEPARPARVRVSVQDTHPAAPAASSAEKG